MNFKGTLTALITPFIKGEVDMPAFDKIVEWQLASGIHGLVPCGSTGESLFLSHEEHKNLIQRCVSIVKGRVPVVAGAGAVTTSECLFLMEQAKEAGADAVLVVSPAYVKPGPEAIYQHYKTLNDKGGLPIIMYNNPSRTGSAMDQETVNRLGALPNIIGIKDATGDLYRPTMTRLALEKDFLQFSGEDYLILAFLAQGGTGWISTISNVAPKLCSDLYKAWEDGNASQMNEIRDTLMPLMKALFMESNPVPVKHAMSLLGFCTNEVRRPLLPASSTTQSTLRGIMEKIEALTLAA